MMKYGNSHWIMSTYHSGVEYAMNTSTYSDLAHKISQRTLRETRRRKDRVRKWKEAFRKSIKEKGIKNRRVSIRVLRKRRSKKTKTNLWCYKRRKWKRYLWKEMKNQLSQNRKKKGNSRNK